MFPKEILIDHIVLSHLNNIISCFLCYFMICKDVP